ncbi:MAG: DNA primase [candidate division WOR-3 bacterium]|nr:MAG: DNA primase [candidate division WOR-3 bacterium]
MIKQDVVERVRFETDIVELVGSYLPLKKVGRNYRGLCPFHQERSPSFYVSPERQTYHCFGCGVGGNAISFVMEHDKLDFPEAVRFLAKRLGIEVKEDAGGRHKGAYEACEQAAQFFERRLQQSETARGYLKHRGVRPETAKRFRLGFAPGGNRLRGEARKRSWPEDDMVKAGLLVERGEGLADYFTDRLIFPIMSISGRIIGFGGRALDEREPKYLNSADTPIYRKGDILYGAYQAKAYIREQAPLLVEGNFDLLSLTNVGVNNVVAPLGTALTPNQGALLCRYNRRVVVCFDGDEAGHKAARAAIEVLLRSGCEPQVALLPSGEDPDSYVRGHGRADFQKLVADAVDLIDFVLAGRKFRTVPDERASLRELVALLRLMSDDAAVELYANRIAERFRVERDTVLRAARREGLKKPRPVAASSPELEERVVAAAVQSGELAQAARDLGVHEIVADERLREVARLAAERCEEPGFGPAQILDAIEDESLRRRVAGWTFQQDVLPGVEEYRARVARMRAAWLHGRILQAHADGDGARAEALTKERGELLRGAAKERSSRS